MSKLYRLKTDMDTISHELFTLEQAKFEVDNSYGAIVAVVTPRSHKVVYGK